MITIFILLGGMIIRCAVSPNFIDSYCAIADYKMFGALASAGVLELIFELRGLVAIFQRKPKDDEDKKGD